MPLIPLLITLIVIGVLLGLVNTYIPMDGKIKGILNAVVVICVVVWLLYAFGIINHSGDIRTPGLGERGASDQGAALCRDALPA
jgi:ABC-type dipeptide/oligopeptide/nickel transport system permease subunit